MGQASQQYNRGQPIDVEIWYVFLSRHSGDPILKASLLFQNSLSWVFAYQTTS